MKGISGDLSLMNLQSCIDWIAENNNSGTLSLQYNNRNHKAYFHNGSLLFLASSEQDEDLGEALIEQGALSSSLLAKILQDCAQREIPLAMGLILHPDVSPVAVQKGICKSSKNTLQESLRWTSGYFEFTDHLPESVCTAVDSDCFCHQNETFLPESELVKVIALRLAEGQFDLPPVPRTLSAINNIIQKDGSIEEILNVITPDQALTAKIFKVVNSAFYSLPNRITSLNHAVSYIGRKALVSLITVHSLSKMITKRLPLMRQILHDGLECAFLCRNIAKATGDDPDEAFVCGLLHNIGKAVLLTIFETDEIEERHIPDILNRFYPNVGSALAVQWQFSEQIQHVLKFHQIPLASPWNHTYVEIVYLSLLIMHNRPVAQFQSNMPHINLQELPLLDITASLDDIQGDIANLI